jgi:hypothetical protein
MPLMDNVPIVRPGKSAWEKFRGLFSPQVNAAIVGWALALLSGGFLLKDRGKIEQLQNDKLSFQAEIGKLTTEKKSAEDRMAFYSSLPFQVPTLVSNLNYFLVNDPTKRQQVAEFFLNLSSLGTNLVKELQSFKPDFALELNGTNLGPFNVIDCEATPQISLRALNTSQITAEHVSIDLVAPLGGTNVIASGWEPQVVSGSIGYHRLVNGKAEVVRREQGHWRVDAQHSIANQTGFMAPLLIVTNYDGIYLPVRFAVSADRASVRMFEVYLMYKGARDRIVVIPNEGGYAVIVPK